MKARTANRTKKPVKAKRKALTATQNLYRLRKHLAVALAHVERLVAKVHDLENDKLALWHRLRVLENGPQSVTQR